METWEVEEEHLIALIYEINRLGQALLKFNEEAYGPYFASGLAEITLSMLGLEGTAAEISDGDSPAGRDGISGDGVNGFDAGPYSYLFNSEVFLNENLIGEILAGIRQNSEGFYKTKAQTTHTGSSVVWEIEERLIVELIQELNHLRPVMGKLEDGPYDSYFSTDLPDIILKMLGIPESYSGIPYDDVHKIFKSPDGDNKTGANEKPDKEKAKHPAAYSRAYDYDMFNYTMRDATVKKFLDHKRKHQDEYRQIRAEQAKLGDKLYETDAYDALWDEMIKLAKSKNDKP
jgi:hypothetical protein